MKTLIDTSILLAYAFSRDANHDLASRALKAIAGETHIVPVPVITELYYMTMVRVNYSRAVQMFAATRTAFEIVDLTDTALMALSERLNITKIYTFDHRDFSIFRPRHCDYLELLP